MDDLDLNSLLDKAPPERTSISLNDDGEVIGGLPIPEKPKRIESILHRTRRRLIIFFLIAIPASIITVGIGIAGLRAAGVLTSAYLTMDDPRPCLARLGSPKLGFSLKSSGSEQSGIYVTDLNGSASCLVSNITGVTSLAWSPAMKRIDAFTQVSGSNAVYTIDMSGEAQRILTTTEATPTPRPPTWPALPMTGTGWSPDGTKLILFHNLINLQTGDQHHLIDGDFVSWSPDSQRIVYINDNPMFSIDVDGSKGRSAWNFGVVAFWLPDEKHIIYVDGNGLESYDGTLSTVIMKKTLNGTMFPSPDRNYALYFDGALSLINLNKGTLQQIQPITQYSPQKLPEGQSTFIWSPDSKYFASVMSFDVRITSQHIYVFARDGSSSKTFPIVDGTIMSNVIWIP